MYELYDHMLPLEVSQLVIPFLVARGTLGVLVGNFAIEHL